MSKKQKTERKLSKRQDGSTAAPRESSVRSKAALYSVIFLLLAGLIFAGVVFFRKGKQNSPATKPYVPRSAGQLTFSRDVAPIIFKNCSSCHRPNQSGPFSLLNYADVKKHAKQIAEVTARRYMPPWLPEPGYGEFADERRLSIEDLGVIQQWVAEGASEGNPSDVPALPHFVEGWQLGQPDLIVQAPAYALAGEGKDVYRNLVFNIPVSTVRYVKGVEFQPGNAKVVHHAFLNIDETARSRRLADKQNPPGFDGMEVPETALMPGGQLLGWQPGKVPYFGADGLSWVLKPNSDFVLQIHMNPSGKSEIVQPAIGLYFTDRPPTNTAFVIKLTRLDLDIPAGATNYEVEQSYILPVDVSLVRVGAHAHYLGKDLQGYAELPTGEKRWLLRIKDWDFNRQGDYRYAEPVSLPKGSKLVMRYSYDNSTNNIRNPNHPPQPVRYGLQSSDEMAELFFQTVARTPQDYVMLLKDFSSYYFQVSMDFYAFLVRLNPGNAEAHMRLGRGLSARGDASGALSHLITAIRLSPKSDQAHYELASLLLRMQRLEQAYQEFQTVTRLNPDDYQAFGSLGYICMTEGRRQEAQTYFETALRLNPDDAISQKNLKVLRGR